MNDRQAYATLLLVILFWAGNYPVGKLGVGNLGPLTLTGGRALLAGPLLHADHVIGALLVAAGVYLATRPVG
jgi:drug/metabolite transporter (DMT)-like permease